jgi:hypothetical protein
VREAFENAIRACRRVTLQAELRAEFGTQFEWLLSGYDTGAKRGVMAAGRLLRSGGRELALELERTGYDWVDQELERLAADGQQAERSPVEVG